ncbi:MAG: PAS domain-containing sensor histidine kinase [Synergistales bacterium]|nr:PAS domain-containing sensor histidine kinase [Synergistales bacterium]
MNRIRTRIIAAILFSLAVAGAFFWGLVPGLIPEAIGTVEAERCRRQLHALSEEIQGKTETRQKRILQRHAEIWQAVFLLRNDGDTRTMTVAPQEMDAGVRVDLGRRIVERLADDQRGVFVRQGWILLGTFESASEPAPVQLGVAWLLPGGGAIPGALGRNLFVALLAAAGAAVLFGEIAARRITKPINALARAASQGRAVALSPGTALPDAEIRELETALRGMAERYEDTMRELEEERAYLEHILASLPVGVLVVGKDDTVLYSNPPLAQLLRMEPKKGYPFQGVLRVPDLVNLLEEATQGNEGMQSVTLREEALRHIVARAVPVRGGAVAVFQDMTERHLLEESRKNFVADAGHELQTPLAIIRAAAELLIDDVELPGDRKRFITRILEQQERMSELVDDLLFLSRVESGKALPLNLGEQIDLVEICTVAQGEVALHPLAGNILWEMELPDAAHLYGWREGLLRCVTNLLDNAVKYTHERYGADQGGRVRIVLRARPENWELQVSDNGTGIPKTQQENIFERFRRGEPARVKDSRTKGGYGLGLSIVKRVSELHGGSIALESSDAGTSFLLRFPKTLSSKNNR